MSEGIRSHSALDLWRAVCAPDARRRLLVTAFCIIVYVIGAKIPAPGLSPDQFRALVLGTNASDAMWRLSIFALDLNPILSALILAQIFRLAWPSFAARTLAVPSGGRRFNTILLAAALALAAAQAFGFSNALESMTGPSEPMVIEPGTTFRLGFVATLVAATALLYWLAGIVTQHGIGSGFWLLLALPPIAELWTVPAHFITAYERHQITAVAIAVLVAGIVAAVALFITAARALQRDAGARSPRILADALLWPPIIAGTLTGFVAVAAVFLQQHFGFVSDGPEFFQLGTTSYTVLFVTMIVLLTLVMSSAPRPLALVAAAATSLVYLALNAPYTWFQIPFLGNATFLAALIVAVVLLPRELAPYFPDLPHLFSVPPEDT